MTELTHAGVKGMKWGVRKAEIKADRKTARKTARKEVHDSVKSNFTLKTKAGRTNAGLTAVGSLLLSPQITNVVVGASIAKSSGYSTGASVVTGLLGGTPGAILMSEIAIRKRVNAANPKG